MRMSVDEFEMLTPAQFIYAYFGWSALQIQLERQAWERTRWHGWVGAIIQIAERDRLPMTEMLPLPWDAVPEPAQELTLEERKARADEMKKFLKK